MFTKALVASIAIAFQCALAEQELVIEQADLEILVNDKIEEAVDKARTATWANRATGPEVPGWFKGDIY